MCAAVGSVIGAITGAVGADEEAFMGAITCVVFGAVEGCLRRHHGRGEGRIVGAVSLVGAEGGCTVRAVCAETSQSWAPSSACRHLRKQGRRQGRHRRR